MTVSICEDVSFLREHVAVWRASGKRIALVPTMGALHAGHLSLISAAREMADRIIVSIFVNPTQFAPHEDFKTYPRDIEADSSAVEDAGADLIYAPRTETIYPNGFATTIEVAGPALADLEDRFRPTHFRGVATIVAKLLMQVQPDVALFGEKDFQQLLVIERMVGDLDFSTEIVGVPTLRAEDGLALSSRNVFLNVEERAAAPALHEALVACAAAIAKGEPLEGSLETARRSLTETGFAVDYVEARHAETLAPIAPNESGPMRVLAAVRLGSTRLIDNVGVGV